MRLVVTENEQGHDGEPWLSYVDTEDDRGTQLLPLTGTLRPWWPVVAHGDPLTVVYVDSPHGKIGTFDALRGAAIKYALIVRRVVDVDDQDVHVIDFEYR